MRYPKPLVLCLTAISACGGGTTVVQPPPPPPTADFTLTLVPHPDDAATAGALGWQSGIPAVAGTIAPADSSAPPAPFTANGAGRAVFNNLAGGDYLIEAARWLDAGERSRLVGGDDAVGFAGRWRTRVTAQGGSATLEAPASRRHGLVISEWAFNRYEYAFGGYLELYNNADTTIYLDGIIVGEGWNASLDAAVTPCAATAAFRNDPQGIWSRLFSRFPGSGRDHPIAPGQTVTVATDAIDHRQLSPRDLDLSQADFEFTGPVDVDNPAVPNMIDVGLIAHPLGHGSNYFGLVQVPFLALPLDVATLTRAVGPGGSAQFARIPADRVLDVFALGTNYPPPGGFNDCPPLVHPSFDRKESRVRGTDDYTEYTYSVSRRRVPVAGGTIILQHTRNGESDLVRTPRTPGVPGNH